MHRALLGSESGQRTLTLNEVAAHLPRPCFVKIDVDGPEVAVLEGAAELLADPQVSWLIEVHGPDLETRCCEILTGAGLETETIDNARWRLLIPEERPVAHNRWLAAYSSTAR
ncbi:MAG: FkbM family methyltransferase [Acidimicrobiales bacterium]